MGTLYIAMKHSHLLLVAISLSFFIIRGIALLMQAGWLQKKWAKISPHIIDTFLLATGIALTVITHQYPISDNWLTAKMVFLVGYILFGIKMMKTNNVMLRRSFFAAAIICIIMMVTIARTHHPLGLFSLI